MEKVAARFISLTLVFYIVAGNCLYAHPEGTVRGSDYRPNNNLYFNLFGDFSHLSVNYERIYSFQRGLFLSSALGIGLNQELAGWPFPKPRETLKNFVTLPHHLTINIGGEKNFLETGIGAALVVNNSGNISFGYVLLPIIGYRLYPTRPLKLNFRFSISYPIWVPAELKNLFIFPFGICLGYNFD